MEDNASNKWQFPEGKQNCRKDPKTRPDKTEEDDETRFFFPRKEKSRYSFQDHDQDDQYDDEPDDGHHAPIVARVPPELV